VGEAGQGSDGAAVGIARRGNRHHLHPDAARVSVSGCNHRLGEAAKGSIGKANGIADEGTRRVLSWRLSNTLTAGFCVDALSEALARFGKPRIFNSDQGSQFTSEEFTRVLLDHGIEISMDGRGRCHDNIFVERLWWTVKHEWVYLRPAANGLEQKHSLVEFFDWYNRRRPHQALGWQTPDEAYFNRPASAVAEAA